MTCGIYSYFLNDVTDPPPELFLRNPNAYVRQLQSATGIVLFWFLRMVGIPVLQWQKAARDGDGQKHEVLHAHMFHACRCWGNKPNCTFTSILALVSYFCTQPKIRDVVHAFSSISLLGRVGMAIDRVLEYVNMLQQKRMVAHVAFDKALHNTDLLQPMLHVDHAYREAMRQESPGELPVTTSMIFQARAVQDHCLHLAGSDLTIPDPLIHTWYSGNSVPLDAGDYRFRKPWLWLRRVAEGVSVGAGRARAESAAAYVRNAFLHHMFHK